MPSHRDVARQFPFDRLPTGIILQSFQQNVGNHAATVRWNYTVPVGRKAFINGMVVAVWIRGLSGVGGIECFSCITLNNTLAALSLLRACIFDANVYSKESQLIGESGVFLPGNILFGIDYVGAAGPLVDHLMTAILTEFQT